MTTRVAIVGGTGKLGGIVHAVIDDLDGFEIAAVLSSRSDLARSTVPTSSSTSRRPP